MARHSTTHNVRSYFPNQGSNLRPLYWKYEVLTTGPPGNSLFNFKNKTDEIVPSGLYPQFPPVICLLPFAAKFLQRGLHSSNSTYSQLSLNSCYLAAAPLTCRSLL